MAITINTNISSMIVQSNLSKATNSLNKAIERMTTGYKINRAADNAAGYSIMKNWETKLSSLDVASENAAMGADLLKTAEENYGLITSHLQRVRDLTEQAANGTYGADSLSAIKSEITARLEEIDRISANCEYNGISLMKDNGTELNLQIGTGSDANSKITLAAEITKGANIEKLCTGADLFGASGVTKEKVAEACTTQATARDSITKIDKIINDISGRVVKIGAAQNRIESAMESISVQSENITSSLSTLRDADVAEESSSYIKAQILQQASATLLSTANQTPSIALNLI